MSQPIRRALLSVSDKRGLLEFATGLRRHGVEIISTGGTARELAAAGIEIVQIDAFTGFPEMLDGRVKTLHPKVHAGILYRREDAAHREAMERHDLRPVDLVCVNLYPFEETVAQSGVSYAEAVEQIDIGGPSMTRSAAKNHADVTVVVSPERYAEVLAEMDASGGATSPELRRRLAVEAFRRTAAYDGAIVGYFAAQVADVDVAVEGAGDEELPARWDQSLPRVRSLRYGENPHQAAALYGDFLSRFRQLHGKELSYNNILDLSTAQEMAEVLGRRGPAVAIIKHANPCGAAVGTAPGAGGLVEAWTAALATDPASAGGGIIGCSAPVDAALATAMKDHFIEVLIAPAFSAEALEILRAKKNRILLECPEPVFAGGGIEARTVPGGVLAQTRDRGVTELDALRVVTEREPTEDELAALVFAWDVARFVKSNAILFAARNRTLAVGAGQMSRVDAARLAVVKAQQAALDLSGSVVASDAFFPFADGLLVTADAGATAVVQPGGSRRDDEVIAAADERGIAMVFTGARHFRH